MMYIVYFPEGRAVMIEEKILVKKAQKDDMQAFEQLVDNYRNKVFNIAYRIIGNYEDASELAQEVFIRIYKALKKFKGRSSFSTWVYSITKNVCYDEIRKRKNKKIVYLDNDIELEESKIKRQLKDEGPQPDEIIEKSEIGEIIQEAIQKLSFEHRIVIVLRDIQGYSYDEIAEIVNCPAGTVKSRISRARKSLKRILEENRELLKGYYVK